jgi:hypothetical protein
MRLCYFRRSALWCGACANGMSSMPASKPRITHRKANYSRVKRAHAFETPGSSADRVILAVVGSWVGELRVAVRPFIVCGSMGDNAV